MGIEQSATLWEVRHGSHTCYGFDLSEDSVTFRYSGPFDESDEWINTSGTFKRADFAQAIRVLLEERQAEVKGVHGETLRFRVLPTGLISLDLNTGYLNNLAI